MNTTPDQELRSLEERFKRRQFFDRVPYPRISPFQLFSRFEREFWIGRYLQQHFGDLHNVTMLEVGAGSGANVYSFLQLGIQPQNFFANELVPSLAEELSHLLPPQQILVGDISALKVDRQFDVVFASTVFSSILNQDLAHSVAARMWRLTRPGGAVLWYDLRVDNPTNPDVRGIALSEVRRIFPEAKKIQSRSITLAPPIGRRVGRFYNFLNFPILRSHLLVKVDR